MSWIVDIELVEAVEAQPPDAFTVVFDVIYPGETWCRCLVHLTPGGAQGSQHEIISRARDALLQVLERELRPVSAELRVTGAGVEVLHVVAPDIL